MNLVISLLLAFGAGVFNQSAKTDILVIPTLLLSMYFLLLFAERMRKIWKRK